MSDNPSAFPTGDIFAAIAAGTWRADPNYTIDADHRLAQTLQAVEHLGRGARASVVHDRGAQQAADNMMNHVIAVLMDQQAAIDALLAARTGDA